MGNARNNASSTSNTVESLSSEGLHDLLLQPQWNVLILDVRNPNDYLSGHIKWKTTAGAVCGVVNIDPQWMSMPG